MDRVSLLTPALLLLAVFLGALAVYGGLTLVGRAPETTAVKHNQLFGPFLAGFLVWLISPIERLLVGRVSANTITLSSLLMCVAAAVAAALGNLPYAVWLYAFAGILDVLDGRLARQSGKPLARGALFDSVSDRWGELAVFTGYAWYLHDSPWLLAVMAASAGSMMVSYTRARAEGLGVQISSGLMQRAERIVLVAGGTLVAAWYAADPGSAGLAMPIVGVTMLSCGVLATATALGRWVAAYRALAAREAEPAVRVVEPAVASPALARPAAAAELRNVARAVEQH